MKLRTLATLYFKARVLSWLTNSANTVVITTTAGQGVIAGFVNGRRAEVEAYAVPSFVPAEWSERAGQDSEDEDNEDDEDDEGEE